MIMIHITLAVGFKNTAPIKERQVPIVDGVPSIGIVISVRKQYNCSYYFLHICFSLMKLMTKRYAIVLAS